ncbi:MAG: helix-turn-helix domain-containing protein [Chloroflexi bacterium]|nr:helix-turn-helix domain-containing protein [Chloroflexota bacterium]
METVSAQEAAEMLGISVATLYSYVSRGLIHSEPDDESRRTHRYSLADVRRLKARQQARRQPDRRAEGALHWGVPVLESAITQIIDGRIFYRGWDALALASEPVSFEQTTAILWGADIDTILGAQPPPIEPPGEGSPLERMQAALLRASAADVAAYDLRPDAVRAAGGRILQTVTQAVTGQHSGSIAERLARAWGSGAPGTDALITMALILCADHELNVSAFTVRTVASAQATPYQAVVAGLAALSGAKHGGFTYRVAALFNEVGTPERAASVVRDRLRRGDDLPGFGHPLYPKGDPRARLLLDRLGEQVDEAGVALGAAIEAAAYEALGRPPTVDFALTVLARVLGTPDAAITLFALGRTAGWIAHALEGYAGRMIRPRARYVGQG